MPKLESAAALEARRQQLQEQNRGLTTVAVTDGSDGRTRGSRGVAQAFRDEIARQGLKDKVIVRQTGCQGFCEQEPTVLIMPGETCYVGITEADVAEIVSRTLGRGETVTRLLYTDPATSQAVEKESEIPFYKTQSRLILGANRWLDMLSIDDYLAIGGYAALAKALEMGPETVLDEVKKSGLRGRGGGGFPTGIKWETTRNAPEAIKYVIVNADEGDPGAYMDRSLLEGNPHSVIEGLIIGAYAIGARQGFGYVRQEYPLAVANLEVALEQARECGLLGPNILGSGFDFDVVIHRGGRGLRLRGIERPDDRHRGAGRRAAAEIHPYRR